MAIEFYNRNWRVPSSWNGTEDNNNKVSNYSMSFDGSSEMVNVSEKFDFVQQTGIFSVSCWIKLDNYTTTNLQEILNTNNIGRVQDGWRLFYDNRGLSGSYNDKVIGFYLYGDNGTSSGANLDLVYKDNAILDNDWHHIAVTGSSAGTYGTLTLYIDGTAVATRALLSNSLTTDTANNDLRIGDYNSNYNFDGKLDHCSIFDYTLSQAQVTELYGSSSTGVGNPMAITNGRKPVAYYPLGDYSAYNGTEYLVANSALSDYVFNFDGGINNGININNNSSLEPLTSFTLSCWIKSETSQNFYAYPVYKESLDSSHVAYGFYLQGSQTIATTVTTSGVITSDNIGDLRDGKWHHVVQTYDGSGMKVYLDGVQSGTTKSITGNVVYSATSTELYIGNTRRTSPSGYFSFKGNISNVAIFNTALLATGTESVASLYNYGTPPDISSYSGLQGWWKLDAGSTFDGSNFTVPDESSNSNSGTSSGMTAANLVQSNLNILSPYSRYALDFDGTSDYIEAPNSSSLQITDNLTLSCWINVNNVTINNNILDKFYDGTSDGRSYLLRVQASRIYLYLANASGTSALNYISTSTLQNNTWYHITTTFSSTGEANKQVKIYINGSLNSEHAKTDLIASNDEEFRIGSSYNTSNRFGGIISNASIWNTALTSAQVTEIYNEGKPSNLNNHSAYSNLVSWWQLGENMSYDSNVWTVIDEKGTNNGTGANLAPAEDSIVNGVGTTANGLSSGMGGADNINGDAPYSTSNALSYGMGADAKSTSVPT